MREWIARLIDRFRRDRLESELDEELRFHQQQLERDLPHTTSFGAQRRLGNLTGVRENARDRWSFPWLDQLQQDVTYALRGVRRNPGFSLAIVATLGLGIGANAAMFGVLDRLMFRPYANLKDPGTAHLVYLQYEYRDQQVTETSTEYTTYLDLRRWATAFSDFSAFAQRTEAVGSGEASREQSVAAVSASFFTFFDAPPALGRYFVAAEDSVPRGADVAVLSYAFWQSEYGGRDVRGELLQIGNVRCAIIGVTPPGFNGVFDDNPPVAYYPITTYAGNRPGRDGVEYYLKYNWGWTNAMVRRKAGVSLAAATADLTNAYAKSWNAARAIDPNMAPVPVAQPHATPGSLRRAAGPDPSLEARTMLWVTGVAGIVLLIACANVANLFLARAIRRRREVAMRLALGVTRRRLAAQSLTESLVLSLLGCAVGVAVAQWGGLVLHRVFADNQVAFNLATDVRTLGVALGASLLAAVLTGLAPAIFGGHTDVASLKTGARAGAHQRSRSRAVLLVLQGTLSVVLLVGAALFVRSLDHVRQLRLGYDVDKLLLVSSNLRGAVMDSGQQVQLSDRLLETARQDPAVEYATWVSSVPFYRSESTGLYLAGIDSVSRLGRFGYQTSSPDYFLTTGTRVLRGRPLLATDRAGAPRVAVVSESMARVLWPGQDALGRCMRVGADTMPCTTVVGIAEDAVQQSLVNEKPYMYYLPREQFQPERGFALYLRMRVDPATAAEGVRKELQKVMPGQTYVTARPLRELIDDQQRSWRLGATMFVAFGALALAVAAIGLYGVISYNVAQRMHELGVRIALGAQRGNLVGLVVGQGLRFALAGVTLGTVLALGSTHWLQPLLFRQSARDPSIYVFVAVLLLVVAITASLVPALRATRADPASALRAD